MAGELDGPVITRWLVLFEIAEGQGTERPLHPSAVLVEGTEEEIGEIIESKVGKPVVVHARWSQSDLKAVLTRMTHGDGVEFWRRELKLETSPAAVLQHNSYCGYCGARLKPGEEVVVEDGIAYCSENCRTYGTHCCEHCEGGFDPDNSDACENETYCSSECEDLHSGARRRCQSCEDIYDPDDSDADDPSEYCCQDCEGGPDDDE